MNFITVKWFKDQFNVSLSSKEGADEFLSIKGCRIVDGQKGPFVSYPSRKQDDGKYWNHVWGSDKFNAVVLSKAQAAMPRQESRGKPPEDDGGDIPF